MSFTNVTARSAMSSTHCLCLLSESKASISVSGTRFPSFCFFGNPMAAFNANTLFTAASSLSSDKIPFSTPSFKYRISSDMLRLNKIISLPFSMVRGMDFLLGIFTMNPFISVESVTTKPLNPIFSRSRFVISAFDWVAGRYASSSEIPGTMARAI